MLRNPLISIPSWSVERDSSSRTLRLKFWFSLANFSSAPFEHSITSAFDSKLSTNFCRTASQVSSTVFVKNFPNLSSGDLAPMLLFGQVCGGVAWARGEREAADGVGDNVVPGTVATELVLEGREVSS
jgi:hypothetical protein